MIQRTTEQQAEVLKGMFELAEAYIVTGDRAKCEKAGKNLAAMIRQPDWAEMDNGLVAILEAYREGFRARFAGDCVKAVQAQGKNLTGVNLVSAMKSAAHADAIRGLDAMRAYRPASGMTMTIEQAEDREARQAAVEGLEFARESAVERGDYTAARLIDEALEAPATPELPQGTFTIVFPNEEYRTIRISKMTHGALEGKIVASFLCGPDNENDFHGFAFVSERGEVKVWKRFAEIDPLWKAAVLTAISASDETRLGMAEAYALRSGRCARCGRTLTVPASLHRGYGPDCAAHLGLA